jgi:two-component system sensor histidine kinase KdpD
MILRLLRSWRETLFPTSNYPVLGTLLGLALVVLLVPFLQAWKGPTGQFGQSIPLFFLIPVLFSSAIGGRVSGAIVSVAAVFVWDWFFIQPLYTVTIATTRDVTALIVFLAVALLTGQLSKTARQRAQEALRRARSTEALYDLSMALIGQQDLSGVLPVLTARLRDTFDLEACAVLLQPIDGKWTTASVAGNLRPELSVEGSRDVAALATWVTSENKAGGFGDRARIEAGTPAARDSSARSRTYFLPLRAGARSIGVLQLVQKQGALLDADQERLLTTFANGVAIVLEQQRLANEERAAEVARESDRMKSALLSSVSHDLRTPLGGIKAAASSLLQKDVQWSEDDRRAFLTDIDAEADRLTRLVSNLLDLSRIEAGAIAPVKEWEDMAELINRVVHRLEARVPDHSIVREVANELGALRVDAVQIEQVLTNLLENAAKYSPAGAPITVSARIGEGPSRAPEMQVSVADRGAGIEDAELGRIFDKFYRVGSTGRRTGGSGMGLAIVKGLAEAHGGRVEVASTPGAGSIFTVALPMESLPGGTEKQHPLTPPVPTVSQ